MFQPCLLIYAISLNIQGQNFLGVVCRGGVGCIGCYYLSQIFFVTWVGAGLSVERVEDELPLDTYMDPTDYIFASNDEFD